MFLGTESNEALDKFLTGDTLVKRVDMPMQDEYLRANRQVFMNKSGLTLVEAIAAIAILIIATVSILATFVMLKASGVNMRHRLQAVNLLSANMENLKSKTYTDITEIYDQPLLIDDNGTPSNVSDDMIGAYSQSVSETEDAAHINKYKTITAALAWQEGSYAGVRNVSESLVTIIAR